MVFARAAVVALLLCSPALAAWSGEWEFSGSASGDGDSAEGEFDARKSTFTNIGLAGSFLSIFTSTKVHADGSADNDSAEVEGDLDLLAGAAIAISTKTPPQAGLAYYTVEVEGAVSSEPNQLDASWDVDAAAGAMAISLIALEEIDEDGTVLQTIPTKDFLWTSPESLDSGNGVKGVSVTGKKTLLSNWGVSIQFLMPSEAGELSFGAISANLQPLAVETVVEVEDFPFSSDESSLKLVFVVASGDVSGSKDGELSADYNDGEGSLFVSFSKEASVDNAKASVEISGWLESDLEAGFGSASLSLVAKTMVDLYGDLVTIQRKEVLLPQGDYIIYDPTMGATGSAGTLSCIAALVMTVLATAHAL